MPIILSPGATSWQNTDISGTCWRMILRIPQYQPAALNGDSPAVRAAFTADMHLFNFSAIYSRKYARKMPALLMISGTSAIIDMNCRLRDLF